MSTEIQGYPHLETQPQKSQNLEKKTELLYAIGLLCTNANKLRNEIIQNLFLNAELNMSDIINKHGDLEFCLEKFRQVMIDLYLESLQNK